MREGQNRFDESRVASDTTRLEQQKQLQDAMHQEDLACRAVDQVLDELEAESLRSQQEYFPNEE
jgi:hypothetical protein